MAQLFANAARSTLTASITSSSTQLQINPADQALFPVATGADWFKVALEDSSGNLEFMKVQRAVGQSLLTITERATEDATKFPARAFVAGALVELRMTAADIASSIAHPSVSSGAHAAAAISVTPAGGIIATNVQAALQELDSETAAALGEKVSLTGDETIDGVKTFSSSPLLPGNASTSLQPVPKQQLDSASATLSALSFSGLSLSASGTSAGVSITAGEVLLRSADGAPKLASAVSLTVDTSTVGANGLDAGTLAASTWYAVWIINNGTTTAGLISLSATSPTMPSGYTHKARVGWIRTDGTANKYPIAFVQRGKRVQYALAGALTAFPQMFYGTTSGAQAVAVGSFCPTTAGAIALSWGVAGTGSGASIAIGPSAAAAVSSSSGFAYLGSSSVSFSAINNCQMLLESSSIYVNSSNGNGFIGCTGWEDNL